MTEQLTDILAKKTEHSHLISEELDEMGLVRGFAEIVLQKTRGHYLHKSIGYGKQTE